MHHVVEDACEICGGMEELVVVANRWHVGWWNRSRVLEKDGRKGDDVTDGHDRRWWMRELEKGSCCRLGKRG